MAYDYEALYRDTPNALGEPTKEIVEFFQQFDQPIRILDIGAGQGRDALFLGRAGHSVVAVDFAPSGIRDINATAMADGLAVQGIVADITDYTPEGAFDVVLIDRTLHMLDDEPRLAAFAVLLDAVDKNGWCVIADERSNIAGFKSVADAHEYTFRITHEKGGYLHLQRTA